MACVGIVTVLGLLFVFVFGDKTETAPGGKKGRRTVSTVFSVKTEVAEEAVLHGYVIANGEIESQNSVNVYPDVSGKVIETNVLLGSSVRRGDIIAYVDPSAPGEYFKKSPVYAPISGSIISTPLKNGTTVSTNSVIAIVGDISNLQVNADIPERYVAVLKPGLKANVSVEAYPNVIFPATVTRVSPVVDVASRTKEIILHFDSRDRRVNAGMFGKIKLYTEDYSGEVVLPSDGIVQLNDVDYVYVVIENGDGEPYVERRKVKTGASVDGRIQILEGVAAGEKVVVQGQTSLSDGSKVRDITAGAAGNGDGQPEKANEPGEQNQTGGKPQQGGAGRGGNGASARQ